MKAKRIFLLCCNLLIALCSIGIAITATKCTTREFVAMIIGLSMGAIVTSVGFIQSIAESKDDEES